MDCQTELSDGPNVARLNVARLRMRRFLSLMMASAILIAGFALAAGEIIRPEGIRPFLLVGAGLMIGAAGWWLVHDVGRMWRR
jgi:hypothetical protein